jgi:beta-glucosidase
MPAYHDIDNESCHASRHLLTEVLREKWGFDGLIVADYIGISLLYQHHNLARDPAEAAAMAFNAGLDIELPADDCASHLGEAISRGLVAVETIDAIVSRILVEKLRLGLFEKPYADESAIELQVPATVRLARDVARQAVVVLENDGILPLDPGKGQRIALIGPTADDPLALLCGYSFPVHLILNDAGESASQVVTPRAALEKAFGAGKVACPGCHSRPTAACHVRRTSSTSLAGTAAVDPAARRGRWDNAPELPQPAVQGSTHRRPENHVLLERRRTKM